MNSNNINITRASRILKSISNESRLKILFKLSENPMSVSVLNKHIKISQSALSQHLNMLKLANIIDSKRNGTYVTYSITNDDIINIVSTLQEIYSKRSKDFQGATDHVVINEQNVNYQKILK